MFSGVKKHATNQKANNFKGRSDNGIDWVELYIPCNFSVSSQSTKLGGGFNPFEEY